MNFLLKQNDHFFDGLRTAENGFKKISDSVFHPVINVFIFFLIWLKVYRSFFQELKTTFYFGQRIHSLEVFLAGADICLVSIHTHV